MVGTNSAALSLHSDFQELLEAGREKGVRVGKKRYATVIADSLKQEAEKRRTWVLEEGIVSYHALFAEHRNSAIRMDRIAERYEAAAQGLTSFAFRI